MFCSSDSRRDCWFFALTFLFIATAVSADPEFAETLAEKNAATLSSPGLHFIDSYCFSVGVYRSTGTTDGEMAATEEGATLVAYSHYLTAALIIDDVPRGISGPLRDAVRKSAADKVIRHLQVSGVEEIDDDVDDLGNVRVVLAVRSSAIDAEKRHWNGCVTLVRDSGLEGDDADARLWAEVLANTGKDPSPATDAWLKIVCARPGLAATVHGTPIGVTDGWTKLPEKIDDKTVSGLTDERLLELLNRRPFDGTLIDGYQKRLRDAGHVVASKSMTKWHRVTQAKLLPPPSVLEATFQAAGLKDSSAFPGVFVVLKFGDSWPKYEDAQASPESVALFKNAESNAESQKALLMFLKQFSEEPSVDVASYVAASLLAFEQPAAAEFWSRCSFEWSPTHPYAGVNLMRAIEKQNRVADAKTLAADLAGKKFLDDWGQSEVNRVLTIGQPDPSATKNP